MKIRRKRASAQVASIKIKEQLLEEFKDEREWVEMRMATAAGWNTRRLRSRKGPAAHKVLLYREEAVHDGKWPPRPKKKKSGKRASKTTTSTSRLKRLISPAGVFPSEGTSEANTTAEEDENPVEGEDSREEPSVETSSALESTVADISSAFSTAERMSILSWPISSIMAAIPKKVESDAQAIKRTQCPVSAVAFDTYCFCAACNQLIFDYEELTGENNSICQCHPKAIYGIFFHANRGKENDNSFACYRSDGQSFWGRPLNPEKTLSKAKGHTEGLTVLLPGGKRVCFDNSVPT